MAKTRADQFAKLGPVMHEIFNDIVILIPAYNPGRELPELAQQLRTHFKRIILVDDGSTTGQKFIDETKPLVESVLIHPRNRGKGAALKTGFQHLLKKQPFQGVVTVDADGQHLVDDIVHVAEALRTNETRLVLGMRVRTPETPFRSWWGNWWTRQIFRLIVGLDLADTQTGLRGIPRPLIDDLLTIPGERYDYELAMLAAAKNHPQPPQQIPITTVYANGNATSHFRPWSDSVRNFRTLFRFCRNQDKARASSSVN